MPVGDLLMVPAESLELLPLLRRKRARRVVRARAGGSCWARPSRSAARSSQDGITVVVPGGVRVRYVLAGRMDQVGPGLRAADLDRAPAELGVKAPGIQVLLADTEVA